jgi:hypothetical protein
MKNLKHLFSAFVVAILIISCQKEDEISPNDKNSVSIEFDNRIGDQKLVLGTTKAKNASGEEFTVTRLNYFVSNIALKKDDGSVLKFPNNYFLLKQSDANSLIIKLNDIPAGNYTELSYTIGVDSLKSISDVSQRTGVLDPASYGDDNMYWSWNSGYIFFKMEGKSAAIPADKADHFELHIGGFGGKTAVTPNNLKNITLSLADAATVRKNIAPQIHVITDVSKVFDAVNQISLAKTYFIHAPAAGMPVAQNYAKSFVLDHVHNDKQ